MRFESFFLGVLCLVPGAVDSRQNTVSKYASKFLEDLADGMSMPEMTFAEGSARMSDVRIHPMKMYKSVEGRKSFGLEMELKIDEIFADGEYEFDEISLLGLFPIYGKGHFDAILRDLYVRFFMDATRNFTNDTFDVAIVDFNVTVIDSKVNFENLYFDGDLSNFVNELLGGLLPDFLYILSNEGSMFLHPIIESFANEVLVCIQRELASGNPEKCIMEVLLHGGKPLENLDFLSKSLLGGLGRERESSTDVPLEKRRLESPLA